MLETILQLTVDIPFVMTIALIITVTAVIGTFVKLIYATRIVKLTVTVWTVALIAGCLVASLL